MKKTTKIIFCCCMFLALSAPSFAYTTTHHLVNMGRDFLNIVSAPLKAIFIEGPDKVKKMYAYEVNGREKPEKRRLLKYKLFAVISVPAVETKSIIDGIVASVSASGKFCKELLSIPFSD